MKTILKNNLQFRGGFRKRPKTERIVIHHSASSPKTTIEDIHRWHLQRNWAGIGYHYVIYSDGTIYRGRPEWARGAHAWLDEKHEANTNGLGICLIGNFEIGKPTEEQINSLIWLIHNIWKRYPSPELPVIGHKDVMPTSCPGKNFPWEELKKRLEVGPMSEQPEQWKLDIVKEAKEAGLIMQYHNPDDPADKWFVLAVCLNLLEKVRNE